MCLIAFAYRTHPKYKLILAANRDEFYDRPTSVAGWWEDHPQIVGGRDLKAKGTWMAMDTSGRFAAVTNYRDPKNIRDDARSRGDLPTGFLLNTQAASEYSKQVFDRGNEYNGFNLLVMDGTSMYHVSNYDDKINELSPGVYGLSNALLDSNWPKVHKARKLLEDQITDDFAMEDLIRIMQDTAKAEDSELPSTGVPYEWEKALSSMCIRTEKYGTCCSTAITIDYEGNVAFYEQSYPFGDRTDELKTYEFTGGA